MQGLEVVHEFKGEYSKVLEAEKFWHNLFKDKQVGGLEPFGGYLEFFELSEEDIAMILKAPLCNSLKS